MEKVLIIATLWPPNSTTGMYRTKGFVNNLRQSGYEPVLLTLNWSGTQSEQDYIIEDYNGIKIFKVSHRESITKRINKAFEKKFGVIRKVYNLIDKVLWTKGIWAFQEYKKIFRVSKIVMKENPGIKKAIIISDPYQLYYIGYYLNKKYGVNWIADYRDAWTTMEFNEGYTPESRIAVKLRLWLESDAEKKWVGTAKYVTSVSDHYSRRISELVGLPYKTIYNGFFESELKLYHFKKSSGKIVIVYNGTLYVNQKIEIFLDGFKSFIDSAKHVDIEVRFIGAGNSIESCETISKHLKGYEKHYYISKRVSKLELINEINNADMLLLVSHSKKYKGVATSKIFDYFASQKPVICCPGDGDVVEKLLTASGQGFFANSSKEAEELLSSLVEQIQKDGKIKYDFNFEETLKYSRENQTKEMAALLDTL
ncbi:glycosyltransferase family 4 protein [Taibaiella lutea]|uniref:Glycosyltransferase family 4 protein n=1 Tax=Taibaiella lutea TaxID=2608001 RepID=A0A5M6CFN7_9BACT|nr:glycosyltransferase [Taibaiella lutea]KAA5533773.1 glycosyltransferase family 4 protein [Taibaiella lutea]